MTRRNLNLWARLLLITVCTLLSASILMHFHRAQAQENRNDGLVIFPDSSVLFIENDGQFDPRVRYRARSGSEILWITSDGIWITRVGENLVDEKAGQSFESGGPRIVPSPQAEFSNVQISFRGFSDGIDFEPEFPLSTKVVAGTLGGAVEVQTFGGVRTKGFSNSMDLLISGERGRWKWGLVGRRGLVSQPVEFAISGAGHIERENGGLKVQTATGELFIPGLISSHPFGRRLLDFQVDKTEDGIWSVVATDPVKRMTILGGLNSTPEAGSHPNEALLSDLSYSTFFGSAAWDQGDSIAVDHEGGSYVTGYTQAITFTSKTGLVGSNHGIDVYVIKLTNTGREIDYFLWFFTATLFAEDYGNDIAVDENGHAFVTGRTHSPDFCSFFGSVPGYDQTYNGNGDAYLMKIMPDGSGLEFCTYLGGGDIETGNAVVVDDLGNSYVTGGTWSADFPTTPQAYQVQHDGQRDIFITKVDPSGTQLEFSTLLGGSGQDEGTGIDTVSPGDVVVTGWTTSLDFDVTTGAFDSDFNGGTWDGFATSLSAGGNTLIYSSYLGGSEEDRGLDVAYGPSGTAFIAGMTRSGDFPTTAGAFDQTIGQGDCGPEICSDGFVLRMTELGDGLEYGSYIGGDLDDIAYSLRADSLGRAFTVGKTISASTFPTTTNAFDGSHNGAADIFLSVVDPFASQLVYSTFLGGMEDDSGFGIELLDHDQALITGRTLSPDFPVTPDSYDPSFNGNHDTFVSKLSIPITFQTYLALIESPPQDT